MGSFQSIRRHTVAVSGENTPSSWKASSSIIAPKATSAMARVLTSKETRRLKSKWSQVEYVEEEDAEERWLEKSLLSEGQISEKYTDLNVMLGRGRSARVQLFQEIESGRRVAVKVINKANSSRTRSSIGHAGSSMQATESPEEGKSRVNREVKIMMLCRQHTGVIQLLDVYETNCSIFLVLEYASGGELFKRIISRNKLSERDAAKVIAQLAASLQELHQKGIVHRDIKPENMLLTESESFDIKLADFGLATCAHLRDNRGEEDVVDGGDIEVVMQTACGTLVYAAPEVVERKKYNASVDLWSLGVTLFLMLTGEVPFDTVEAVKTVNFGNKLDSPNWKLLSNQAQDIVLQLLQKEPADRLTFSAILAHPWLCQHSVLPLPSKDEEARHSISCDDLIEYFRNVRTGMALEIFHQCVLPSEDPIEEKMADYSKLKKLLLEAGELVNDLKPSGVRHRRRTSIFNSTGRKARVISESAFRQALQKALNDNLPKVDDNYT